MVKEKGIPILNRCVAEGVATFALVFIGAGSIITNLLTNGAVGILGIALAHGLTLAIFVTAIMNISGGHVNPAVTIAAWLTRRISLNDAVPYVIAQMAGAILAAYALTLLYPGTAAIETGLGAPTVAQQLTTTQAIAIEAILTFFLVFAVFGTAIDRRSHLVGGFAIGLTLTVDILMGGPLTGAAMNPARALGPMIIANAWQNAEVFVVGPLIGAIAAALLYHYAFLGREGK